MTKFKPESHTFNGGKSRVVLNYSPINAAFFVYREDGIHLRSGNQNQGNLRIYNDYYEAQEDYGERVWRLQDMEHNDEQARV
tara:strand:+ start:12012 stop:12257 length:246 start_codon:yes stop_codon:yes gene_type:complete